MIISSHTRTLPPKLTMRSNNISKHIPIAAAGSPPPEPPSRSKDFYLPVVDELREGAEELGTLIYKLFGGK